MRRFSAAQRRFIEAIDWTSMTQDDHRRATDRGCEIDWRLRVVAQAIDQRIFELIHLGEE